MRIIRNERRIRAFGSIGQYGSLAGLLALLVGLILSFVKPDWFALMLASVTLGLSLSIIGGFFADRYAGPLAHHKALAQALKGLGNEYVLLQHLLPVPHLLVEPGGCTVFVVKGQGGQVTYEDGKWKHQQRAKFFRQFAGQEAVGAPEADAGRQARKMEQWLSKQLPDAEVPVRPVVLFVNPDVTLEVDDPPVPTFHGKKVKAWLRGPGKLKPLPPAVQSQLAQALGID